MSESISNNKEDKENNDKNNDKNIPEGENQNPDLSDHEIFIPEDIKPLLNEFPKSEQKRVSALVALSLKKSWRGPLPPPDILKEYNEAVPNGAERILSSFERQSEHRMELEKIVIIRELNQSGRGQHYALFIVVLVLIASVTLIYTDHDIAGSILGGIDLVALATVFILGKYSQRKDLERKR